MSPTMLSPGPSQPLQQGADTQHPAFPKEAMRLPRAPAQEGEEGRIFDISSTLHLEELSQHLMALFQLTQRSASSPKPRALVHNLIATDHRAWLKKDGRALLTPSWVQNQAAHQSALTKAKTPALSSLRVLPQHPPKAPVLADSGPTQSQSCSLPVALL